MNYDMKDKIVIVTAGTMGIGRGIVDLLLGEGARVSTCARSEERLKKLQKRYPDRIFTKSADLEKTGEVASFIKDAISKWGGVDHLFYNASNPPKNTLSDLSPEEWDRSYNGILKGLITASRFVIPEMKKRSGGGITVVSSLTAVEPIRYLATSSVLRAGLLAWVRLMAQEHGRDKIRVNAILPGYTRTNLLEEAAAVDARKKGVAVEEIYKEWSNFIPLGRVAGTEEIANAALFLASAGASYITGTSLLVDGGTIKGI